MNKFQPSKRSLLLAAAVSMTAVLSPAHASDTGDWPSQRIINIVVPFPPGGLTDRTARVLAQGLEKSLKQNVVVENRPGAGATIGADYVARAKPDGYTILLATNASHAVNMSFMKLPYDPVKSFEPISLVVKVPNVLLMNPEIPVKTFADLLALEKSKPGELTYTSAGIGTIGHIGMEMLSSMTGMKMIHVPARGPAQALQDVVAGHVNMVFDSVALSAPLIQSDRLRAVAVTSSERVPAMPDMPTLNEAGAPGYELLLWFALFAPAGTPQAIVDKLSEETARVFADPAVREPFIRDGVQLVTSTPAELASFQKSEIEKFAKLIKDLDLKLGQ